VNKWIVKFTNEFQNQKNNSVDSRNDDLLKSVFVSFFAESGENHPSITLFIMKFASASEDETSTSKEI
jgi:hypothetical protein